MFKVYFILLLFCHILGDYYLQSVKMAENKNKSMKTLILHCRAVVLLVVLSHFAIDLVKSVLYREWEEKIINLGKDVYITNQILHLLFLGVCAYIIKDCTVKGTVIELFNNMGTDKIAFMKICTLVLLLHKPANITIKRLIEGYKPFVGNVDEENKKTGAIIGTLERYIILILLFLNQYSAIGLVLTAKSIARYKELENKNFAEYYLIGTLLSTLIVIVVYMFIGR